jgi:translation initiation factor IF-2
MSTGAKMRVYEIAREVGLPNKELIAKIRALGLEVNNHMSSLDLDDVQRVKRSLEKERLANTVTKRLSSTVLRRRSRGGKDQVAPEPVPAADGEAAASRGAAAEQARPAAEQPIRRVRAAPSAERVQAAEPPPAEKPRERAEAPEPTPAEPARSAATAAPAEPVAPAEPAAEREPAKPVEPEPEPEPERAAEAPVKRRRAIVVEGPPVVDLPGAPTPERAQPPARLQGEAQPTPPPRAESKSAEVEPGPQTLAEVADHARGRFEQELERARQQAEERERERERQRAQQQPEAQAPTELRADGRPEVGSIISLPMTRIKITERPMGRAAAPGAGQVRGRFAQQQQQRGRRNARDTRKKQKPRGAGKQTQITTPAEHKRVIRMEETITVSDLARNMGIKANEVLKKLWGMGMMGTTINAAIDHDTAQLLSAEFGYEVQNVAFKEEDAFAQAETDEGELELRAPVVTVMGHVDHGKTSLLDYIRKARVASGEAGGITQHIGAYRVSAGESFGDLVFIDTPGHAAFTEMRARGAQITDIVILVVAADDGVMPQTVEALNHAKDAKVSILVAVNKCDRADAQPDRVRQQLADHGLIPEEWGGDTIYVNVSAHTGENIDTLLESVALSAELLELRASPEKQAVGTVIEAKLDKARGPMATVLVREGTLRVGDIVVAGEHMGKVRALLDDRGKPIKEAGPSTPVEVLGIDGVPEAGETLNATEDEKKAKQVVEYRYQAKRKKELAATGRVSLENLMEKIQEGEQKELKVVLKADVQGSAEAVKQALINLSTPKVSVNVIQAGVGGITETDVQLAKASGAIIIGFHVRAAGKAGKVAEQEGVEIRIYDIIYEALDEVRAAMAGLLAPIKREQALGKAEVRETFTIPRVGVVAGSMVLEGKVQRKSHIRVVRDAVQIYEGKISSLKRFKDDAAEVDHGYECGIMLDGFNDLKAGDVLEAYEIVEEKATL